MNIVVGEYAGFCFGVDRALRMALDTPANGGRVFTLGEIVHNRQAAEALEKRGIFPVHALDGLRPEDSLVIRAHGVGPRTMEEAVKTGA